MVISYFRLGEQLVEALIVKFALPIGFTKVHRSTSAPPRKILPRRRPLTNRRCWHRPPPRADRKDCSCCCAPLLLFFTSSCLPHADYDLASPQAFRLTSVIKKIKHAPAPPRANEKWNTCLGQFRVQAGHAHDLIAKMFFE